MGSLWGFNSVLSPPSTVTCGPLQATLFFQPASRWLVQAEVIPSSVERVTGR